MEKRADLITQAVLSEFDALPKKRKPAIRSAGLHEWIPLSGIVAEYNGSFQCLALATGMKCLPAIKVPASKGLVLHDWHAEILAIRTFNCYLIDECSRVVRDAADSDIVERIKVSDTPHSYDVHYRPFRIKSNVKFHMYCSEAPCGDASMELTMSAQDDSTPWKEQATDLVGRDDFSQLGIVRRKPGRRDAPPTLSKSCSDKIAMRQCTSLLSSLSALFIEPQNAYIHSLVVPCSQYVEAGFTRSFSTQGRLRCLQQHVWPGTFKLNPFDMDATDIEFSFSKRSVADRADRISPCPTSTAWSRSGIEENLVGGVIQGRKLPDLKAASRMSRRLMWLAARELASLLDEDATDIRTVLGQAKYQDVKSDGLLASRRLVAATVRNIALTGWVNNAGDSDFTIDS